jgi:hypothetical protein
VYKNSRSRVFLDRTFYKKPSTSFKSLLFNYYIDFKYRIQFRSVSEKEGLVTLSNLEDPVFNPYKFNVL